MGYGRQSVLIALHGAETCLHAPNGQQRSRRDAIALLDRGEQRRMGLLERAPARDDDRAAAFGHELVERQMEALLAAVGANRRAVIIRRHQRGDARAANAPLASSGEFPLQFSETRRAAAALRGVRLAGHQRQRGQGRRRDCPELPALSHVKHLSKPLGTKHPLSRATMSTPFIPKYDRAGQSRLRRSGGLNFGAAERLRMAARENGLRAAGRPRTLRRLGQRRLERLHVDHRPMQSRGEFGFGEQRRFHAGLFQRRLHFEAAQQRHQAVELAAVQLFAGGQHPLDHNQRQPRLAAILVQIGEIALRLQRRPEGRQEFGRQARLGVKRREARAAKIAQLAGDPILAQARQFGERRLEQITATRQQRAQHEAWGQLAGDAQMRGEFAQARAPVARRRARRR